MGPFSARLNATFGNDVNYQEWSPAKIFFVNSTGFFLKASYLFRM